MRLSPLYVSVHVTDLEKRRLFLRNQSAPDIMEQLRWLAEKDIEVHTQLVIVPAFNDGLMLERSVRELAELWPAVQTVSVVPVGLTKQHKYQMRPHTVDEARVVLDYVESLQADYQDKFGSRFIYPTDEWYLVTGRQVPSLDAYDGQQLQENGLGLVRMFLDEWHSVKSEIRDYPRTVETRRTLTLVTATMFAPLLRETASEFARLAGVDVTVMPVINERLGATITAAGLLMGEDIIQQLKEQGYGELVILPRVTFDHPDTISLDDLSPQQIANQLGQTVALADTMGDVWDALIGQSRVMYQPQG